MSCWQEQLRQEWAAAQDRASRELLLASYAGKIAALPELERESLLTELEDLSSCCTRNSSDT